MATLAIPLGRIGGLLHGLSAILRDADRATALSQYPGHDIAIDGILFGYEDSRGTGSRRNRRRLRAFFGRALSVAAVARPCALRRNGHDLFGCARDPAERAS